MKKNLDSTEDTDAWEKALSPDASGPIDMTTQCMIARCLITMEAEKREKLPGEQPRGTRRPVYVRENE